MFYAISMCLLSDMEHSQKYILLPLLPDVEGKSREVETGWDRQTETGERSERQGYLE